MSMSPSTPTSEQHPRRRWLALRRQVPRRPEPGCDGGPDRHPTLGNAWRAARDLQRPHRDRYHSRVAYAEICADEKADTAVGVLRRAVVWLGERGVIVARVLSDNGSAHRSQAWHQVYAELGITVKKTRPYRPHTNGKIGRFHRILTDGWAYARLYTSEFLRDRTPSRPPGWLHLYNHHRTHSAIGAAPISGSTTSLDITTSRSRCKLRTTIARRSHQTVRVMLPLWLIGVFRTVRRDQSGP